MSELIEEKVLNYINSKNQDDLDYILTSFDNLFISYINYLKFQKKPESSSVKRLNSLLKGCSDNSYKMMRAAYSILPREEIWSDIIYCFLRILNRYKKQDKSFTAYLSSVFHYEIARLIFKYLKEPLANGYATSTLYSGCPVEVREDFTINLIDILESIITEDGYLDTCWINDECSIYFLNMPSFERHTLLLYFQERMTDKLIANTLNKHINTINISKNKAIKLLSEKLNMPIKRNRNTKVTI